MLGYCDFKTSDDKTNVKYNYHMKMLVSKIIYPLRISLYDTCVI